MTQETFKLINAVQCAGIDSCSWGVVENVNTKEYLGTEENVDLAGQYLYVYRDENDSICFISEFTPKYTLTNGFERIDLYKID